MDASDRPPANETGDQLLALEFDFLKHLTSLCVAAIGGAVTFAGALFEDVANKQGLWLAVAIFGVGGVSAFLGQQVLLDGRKRGKPQPRAEGALRLIAIGSFMLGAGVLTGFSYNALR